MAVPNPTQLIIDLPGPVLEELQKLAVTSHRSMTELVRDAFALTKIAYEESRRGNKLTVTDANGKTLKELVISR